MSTYLINGEIADLISVEDRSLHYGDGVFETLVVENGTTQHWDAHIDRLEHGCQRLNISVPDRKQLAGEVTTLLRTQQQSSNSRHVLKIIITRGQGKRG